MDARGLSGGASSSDGQPDSGGPRTSLALQPADEDGITMAVPFFGKAAEIVEGNDGNGTRTSVKMAAQDERAAVFLRGANVVQWKAQREGESA